MLLRARRLAMQLVVDCESAIVSCMRHCIDLGLIIYITVCAYVVVVVP